jgi:ketosteroid isomerase-like protein
MMADGADDRPAGSDPTDTESRDPAEATPRERVRAYYRALDEGEYDLLASLLHPEFVHDRPDMTLDGRDRFVAFMRDERPMTDTTHPLAAVYEQTDGTQLAARGRLVAADGTELTRFVDVFTLEGERFARLETFVD